MLEELDTVVLMEDVPAHGLKRGDIGYDCAVARRRRARSRICKFRGQDVGSEVIQRASMGPRLMSRGKSADVSGWAA